MMQTIFTTFLFVLLFSCSFKNSSPPVKTVRIDGSSTVFPITEALVEEFLKHHPKQRITIGISGTGGGFKKLIRGEIDINNASRRIKPSEAKLMKDHLIDYIELPIAYDGISVVVNKDNTWVDYLSTEELKKIWSPQSKVSTWKDIRATWPAVKLRLYGPGTDSGTFDYFTSVINGKEQSSRHDFTPSENDNVLVQGIAGDSGSLGYFGYAYYAANKEKIKAVPIQHNGVTHVPTMDTIKNNLYKPLSRPLFLYIRKTSLEQPETRKFIDFYIKYAASIVPDVGYVSMNEIEYSKLQKNLTSL